MSRNSPILSSLTKVKFALWILVFAATVAIGLSSIRKSLSTILPGQIEVQITYQAAPHSEIDLERMKIGEFLNPWGPLMTLSGDLRIGAQVLRAGQYTIGIVRETEDNWHLALLPGRYRQLYAPLNDDVIWLDTIRLSSGESRAYLSIDITIGQQQPLIRKVVLVLHLGNLALATPLQ